MPSYLKKQSMSYLLYGLIGVTVVILGLVAYYNWILSIAGFILSGVFSFFILLLDQRQKREIEEYIATLSYRVKKVGEEALMEMPIGIILINDDYYIEWANPFISSCFSEDKLIGRSLYDVAESLVPLIKQEVETEVITMYDRKFRVILKREEKLLYFLDITEQAVMERLYEEERT